MYDNQFQVIDNFISYLLVQHFDITMHGAMIIPDHGVVKYAR